MRWVVASIVSFCCVLSLVSYKIGVRDGHRAQREETRVYVNARLSKAGFCAWFNESRIAEDCARFKK